MTARDDEPVLEQLADLLPAYDDALREGTPPPATDLRASSPELPARLRRAQSCLRLLRGRWPGSQTDRPGGATAPESPLSDLASPGARLGRFAILRLLGRGGHGVVYLARDPALRREVALKVARPETFLDADLHGRFRREAAAAAGLDHPNLVPVHEQGEVGPWVYIVSAYCPGPSLAAWLREQREPVAIATAAQLVAALADAVAYMHGRGVLHRDIKPGNILLQIADGRWQMADGKSEISNLQSAIPKLTDFGLAKVTDGTRYQTQSGVVLGTPAYMSPEQAAGRVSDLGPATDIYALGVLLYELLTGRPPFRAETNVEVLRQVLHDEPAPPGRLRRGLPRDLESVCLKCLEKKPERRYASAAALADDLRRFLNGQSTRARPLTVWQRGWNGLLRRPRIALAMSAGLLALAALMGVWWYVAGVQDSAAALSADADTARQERDRVEASANAARQRLYAREVAVMGALADEGRLTASQLSAAGPEELRGFDWHYLRRRADTDWAGTEWFVGRGHTQLAHSVAFSPDGQLCASASHDKTIIIWDLAKHALLRQLAGHTLPVTTVAFSPDGKTLASGAYVALAASAELKLWDVATGSERPLPVLGNRMIDHVAFAPDGQTVASCGAAQESADPTVLLWDLRSGQWRRLPGLDGPDTSVSTVAFSPDGKTLAVGCGRSEGPADRVDAEWAGVHLFDLATGTRSAVLTGHPGVVNLVAFTPDGKTLVSGDFRRTVKIWDLASRQARVSYRAGDQMALSPDGNTLAGVANEPGGPANRDVQLWDVATGRLIARVGSVPSPVHRLRFAPGGQHLAVACADGTVRFFDVRNIHDLPGHRPYEAWAVAFAPNGKTLASAGDDDTIRLWSVPDYKLQGVLRGHIGLVTSVAFSPNGHMLASGGFDNMVRLWDVATGREKAVLRGHAQDIRVVAFSPDGHFLATAAKSVKQPVGELKLWDLATGKQTAAPAAHGNCLAFSRDGRLLAFRDNNNAVRFLDLSALEPTHGIPELASVGCVALSPDGKTLATADTEGLVKLWDVRTGTEKERRGAHAGKEVRALIFSPDGKTLASAGMDKTIRLWQAATGLELLCFKNLPDYAHALAFSSDSATLAAACHDGTVRLYLGKRGQ
jgi:WD40 repeat protein